VVASGLPPSKNSDTSSVICEIVAVNCALNLAPKSMVLENS
jgi:hypothetical protein